MHYLTKTSVTTLVILSLSACIFDDTNTEPVASTIELSANNGIDLVTISEATILDSVTDEENDASVSAVTIVSGNGVLTEVNNSWQYQPAINDLGQISLSYTVSDDEFEDTSTISFDVENDSRVAITNVGGVTLYSHLNTNIFDNVKATLYIGNDVFELNASATDGSFAFINLPNGIDYLLQIEELTAPYATEFHAGTTDASTLPVAENLDITDLTQPAQTVLEIQNATTGALITGLEPYIKANEFADPEGELSGLPEVKYYFTEGSDNYTLFVEHRTTETNVYLDLVEDDNGTVYDLVATDLTLPIISTLTSGETDNAYLLSQTNNDFEITISVKDSNDADFNAGPLLPVFNRTTAETEYWEKASGSTNQYSKTLTASEIIQSRVVAPIDSNLDGIIDYAAATESATGFPLFQPLSISDFDLDNQLTVTLTLDSTDYSSPLKVSRISSDSDFQSKGVAEVTFAFDRAIEDPSNLEITTKTLTSSQPNIELNTTATIYEADLTTTTTTDQNESTVELSYSNTYSYTDVNGLTNVLTLGTNGTDETVSPYVTEYDSSETTTTLTSNSYQLDNSGTLLTVTLNSAAIEDLNLYEFSFTIDAPYDDYTSSTFSFEIRAATGSTATVNSLSVDNFNFKDAETLDVLNANSENYLPNLEVHTDTFFELNVGYDAGSTDNRAQLNYLSLNNNGLNTIADFNSNAGIDSSNNTLYLVSPAPISGTIQILNQTETFDNAGAETAQTISFLDETYTLTLDGSVTSATTIIGSTLYIANHPENHAVDATGINEVFGISVVAGANVEDEGIYYIYALPLTLQSVGIISNVEIEFDIVVNGSTISGSNNYAVK